MGRSGGRQRGVSMAAVAELTVRKAEGDLLEVDPLDLGANTPGDD
jgi:hypothetical protein